MSSFTKLIFLDMFSLNKTQNTAFTDKHWRFIWQMTPDENFILDRHPHWKNIIVGAGFSGKWEMQLYSDTRTLYATESLLWTFVLFSGHGFKLAPVVGKILSELATNQKPSYDLSNFSIERFYQQSHSKLWRSKVPQNNEK